MSLDTTNQSTFVQQNQQARQAEVSDKARFISECGIQGSVDFWTNSESMQLYERWKKLQDADEVVNFGQAKILSGEMQIKEITRKVEQAYNLFQLKETQSQEDETFNTELKTTLITNIQNQLERRKIFLNEQNSALDPSVLQANQKALESFSKGLELHVSDMAVGDVQKMSQQMSREYLQTPGNVAVMQSWVDAGFDATQIPDTPISPMPKPENIGAKLQELLQKVAELEAQMKQDKKTKSEKVHQPLQEQNDKVQPQQEVKKLRDNPASIKSDDTLSGSKGEQSDASESGAEYKSRLIEDLQKLPNAVKSDISTFKDKVQRSTDEIVEFMENLPNNFFDSITPSTLTRLSMNMVSMEGDIRKNPLVFFNEINSFKDILETIYRDVRYVQRIDLIEGELLGKIENSKVKECVKIVLQEFQDKKEYFHQLEQGVRQIDAFITAFSNKSVGEKKWQLRTMLSLESEDKIEITKSDIEDIIGAWDVNQDIEYEILDSSADSKVAHVIPTKTDISDVYKRLDKASESIEKSGTYIKFGEKVVCIHLTVPEKQKEPGQDISQPLTVQTQPKTSDQKKNMESINSFAKDNTSDSETVTRKISNPQYAMALRRMRSTKIEKKKQESKIEKKFMNSISEFANSQTMQKVKDELTTLKTKNSKRVGGFWFFNKRPEWKDLLQILLDARTKGATRESVFETAKKYYSDKNTPDTQINGLIQHYPALSRASGLTELFVEYNHQEKEPRSKPKAVTMKPSE